MNEYQKLIEYINYTLNDIDIKIEQLQNQKEELEELLLKINNHHFQEIDFMKSSNILISIFGKQQGQNIINKIQEILELSIFLFDDSIVNPLKNSILEDFEKVKKILSETKEKLSVQSLTSNKLLQKKEQLEKYRKIIDEMGYHSILTEEDRKEFYTLLIESPLSENIKFSLIKNYINYAYRNKKEETIYTSYSSLDIINTNANEVFKELESITEETIETPQLEEIPLTINEIPLNREQEIYQQILNLIQENQNKVVNSKYNLYKNIYRDQELLTILESVFSFNTANGLDWNRIIACIKEKLIPLINTTEREMIFTIFEKILQLNQEQLEKNNQNKELDKQYEKKLKQLKIEIEEIILEINKYRADCSELITYMLAQINDPEYGSMYYSILKQTKDLTEEEFYQSFSNYRNINYKQGKTYILLDKIIDSMDYIMEYINLEKLSKDDFDEVDEIFSKTKENFKLFKKNYKLMLEEIKIMEEQKNNILNSPIESEENEPQIDLMKQYEHGNSVILFYRENEFSKFLVEEDLERQSISDTDKSTYGDLYQILKRTSETKKTEWGRILTSDRNHFKSVIYNNKANGDIDKNNPVKIKSDFSKFEYIFYRYKYSGKTIPRLIGLDVQMCIENRQKLDLSSDKPIVLFVSEHQVMKHSNESQEYADIRRNLKNNINGIKSFIELLENPETPIETLYKILNDSSDLYNYFVKKAKKHN